MTGLIVVAEVGPHCINHIYDVVAGLFKTTHDVHVKDCGLIFVVVLVYVCYVFGSELVAFIVQLALGVVRCQDIAFVRSLYCLSLIHI